MDAVLECSVGHVDDIAARSLFGVPIHAATMPQVLSICIDVIKSHRRLQIGVVNAAKIVNMCREPSLRDAVMSSDLIVADGMAVVWASRLLRRPLPERVAGIDLFERLLGVAERNGFSVYFLGATQEVAERVVEVVRARHPELRIAGSRNGYFNDAEAEQVAQAVGNAQPDMLFLGMTSPKKEVFMEKWGELMNVPVCHGVGGSFDVIAGKVKRAPRLWQRLGLEWLYRVLQEPGRMWKRYLVTNTMFVWMLIKEMVRPSRPA